MLPSLFPSTSAPPKRVRDASEALVHVLEVSGVKCCRIILTAVLKKIITEGAASDDSQCISYSHTVCSKSSKTPKTFVFGKRIFTG